MSLIQDALKKVERTHGIRTAAGGGSRHGRAGGGTGKWPWRLIGIAVAGAVVLVAAGKFSRLHLLWKVLESPPPPTRVAATDGSEVASPAAPPSPAERRDASPAALPTPPPAVTSLPQHAEKMPSRSEAAPGTEGPHIAEAAAPPSPAKAAALAGKDPPRVEALGPAPHTGVAAIATTPEPEKHSSRKPVVDGKDRYHFNMGLFYQGQGEYARAAEAYEKAVELNPFHVEAYNNLGVLYKEVGELDKAIERYRKALAIDPNYVKAYNNLGVVLIQQGALDEAAAQFTRAIELNPKNVESYTNLGVIHRRYNRIPEAFRAFHAALGIDPNHAETHYNLALLMEGQGRVSEAVEHYRRFLAHAEPRHRPVVVRVVPHLQLLIQSAPGPTAQPRPSHP